MSTKKLYRSKTDRMIGGVCGGLSDYLGIDPIIFRFLFVVLLFGAEFGFLLYILMWIIVPEEGTVYGTQGHDIGKRVQGMGEDIQQAVSQPHPQAGIIVGGALIFVGAMLLLNNLNFHWLRWLDFDLIWPALLIIGGIVLLVRRNKD